MRIVGTDHIERFAKKHPESRRRFEAWMETVRGRKWKNTADVRGTFTSVDFIEGKTVFDIGGGNYRLVATIDFRAGALNVTHVLTHREYDKEKWK